ncbi:MAG: carboxylesterase family protein [Burkholderiales bacterium]
MANSDNDVLWLGSLSRRRFAFAAGSVLALPLTGCGGGDDSDSAIVSTTSGRFEGVSAQGVISFKGIPYAQAPTGGLRFMSPQPFKAADDRVKPASAFGGASLQSLPPYVQWIYSTPLNPSEDCLYANIWTPGVGGSAPVIFILHGGAWRTGASSMPLFDGQKLASLGCVVVTISFRLGALGTLSHPDLADPTTGAAANWQLQDQAAALKWVAANIASFGGDPKNICVVGQSAGGTSAAILAQHPDTRSLVKRAVLLSPAPVKAPSVFNLVDAARYAELVAAQLNSTVTGLRSVAAADLIAAEAAVNAAPLPVTFTSGRGVKAAPVVDGQTCLASWSDSDWPVEIAVVITSTLTEGNFFVNLYDQLVGGYVTAAPPATRAELVTRVTPLVGGPTKADSVVTAFQAAAASEGRSTELADIYAEIYGDVVLRAPAVQYAQRLANAGNNVRYGTYMHSVLAPGAGAPHCADLPMLFGTYGLDFYAPKFGASSLEAATSAGLMAAVSGFAANGDPSFASGNKWTAYTGSGATTALMAPGTSATFTMGPVPKSAQLSAL